MREMTVYELLGIDSGDAITVDNPWSDQGPREVIPLALSRNGISIRAIDCRYGDICYVGADWSIYMNNGVILELRSLPYVAHKIDEYYSGKREQKEEKRSIRLEHVERECASINEVLQTLKLENLKVAITGTLPIPRAEAKALFESKGAIVVSAVNKKTSYLFMGNTGHYEVTDKMKRAHDFGIKIITL
ncbi:BRCT domain-containing protein [Vibrio navarrensis]